ncbi:MAG: glutathione S-transferase N-terminal domain-containing protein [Methyloceanibacter sp.]|nr:glutathione S-transferase N-terminal domain-containing protein [Methyloceanibacter sp.]
MSHTRPKLLTIGISHFCEKARWALDWHGVDHDEASWPPGVHAIMARRYGAKSTALPILVIDQSDLIQGSGAIIDWADQNAEDVARRLTVANALEIERRADAVIGIHIRRLSYAKMLSRSAHLAKPALFHKASPSHRLVATMMWPVTRRLMIKAMDLGPGAAAQSHSILEAEFDWLDGILADGRPYLAGEHFSRADIAVASFLAPIVQPKEMPAFHNMALPQSLLSDFQRWRGRPVMRWTATQYRQHRAPRKKMARA